MEGLRPPGLDHQVTNVPPLRGFGELARPLAAVLPPPALLALASGLSLRSLSTEPDPAGLMSVLGMLCWLLGLLPAGPVQHVLQRLDRHRRNPVRQLATRGWLLLALTVAAGAVSLAMLPVHFAYDQSQDLFSIQTLNVDPVTFRSGYFMLLLHIAAAPAYLLVSTGLLRLLRLLLPASGAHVLWLLAGSLLCVVPAALDQPGAWPFSLGQYSSWMLEFMYANKQLASPYIQELVRPVVLRLAMVWGIGLGLCWLSFLPIGRALPVVRPLWLAACTGIIAGGARIVALSLRWTDEVLPLSPADWTSVLLYGTLATWIAWLACLLSMPRSRVLHSLRRDSAWLLLLPAALLAMTASCLQAGDASQLRMASAAILLLPLLLLGLVLPLQASRLGHPAWRLLCLLLCTGMLLLPAPRMSPIAQLLLSMQPGFQLDRPGTEQLRVWACLVLLLLISWPGLLQSVMGRYRQLALPGRSTR